MTPRPLPPDQIKPIGGVGIYEGEGSARTPPQLVWPDVDITLTLGRFLRYRVAWGISRAFPDSFCNAASRMTLRGAQRKARRMQQRIDAQREFRA